MLMILMMKKVIQILIQLGLQHLVKKLLKMSQNKKNEVNLLPQQKRKKVIMLKVIHNLQELRNHPKKSVPTLIILTKAIVLKYLVKLMKKC